VTGFRGQAFYADFAKELEQAQEQAQEKGLEQ
jgi:hypothetical protein